MNAFEVLEDLIDDDPFIRAWPRFEKYLRDWNECGGREVDILPEGIVQEFYAEKIPPEEALHIWFTYSPVEQIKFCYEVLDD